MLKTFNFKHGLIVFFILVFALSWIFGLPSYLNFEILKAYHYALSKMVAEYYYFSLLIYVVLYVIVACCAIPATAFIAMTGGFLFDQWVGTILTVFAATSGALIIFLSVRPTDQQSLMTCHVPWVEKLRNGFQKNAFTYLLMLRLTPVFPFFAVNLAAALLSVPLRTFIVATLMGMVPIAFVYSAFGSSLQNAIQR